jgi:sortase (surface protein transpeptidase)
VLAAPKGDGSAAAAGLSPKEATVLTLITCEPKLSTSQRLVKQAELTRTDDKGGDTPRELKAKTRR